MINLNKIFMGFRNHDQGGVISIITVLFIAFLTSMILAMAAVVLPRLRVSSEVKRSVGALYAADSATEWCIYVNHKILPPNGPNSAAFVKVDTTTHGSWQGTYGSDGYDVFEYLSNYPGYVAGVTSQKLEYTWQASTNDVRALKKPDAADRIAATWYGDYDGSLIFTIDESDTLTHQIALYLLDWDTNLRNEMVTVTDAATGATLDSQRISQFNGGKYLIWNIKGDITFQITCFDYCSNAVIAGMFFDPATVPAVGSMPVQWVNVINANTFGGTIQRNNFVGDSGGVSSQEIVANNDGYVESRVQSIGTYRSFGLTRAGSSVNESQIDFAMYLTPNSNDGGNTFVVDVHENGQYKATSTYKWYDILRVAAVNGQVQYSINGNVFYTSAIAPTYPLIASAYLNEMNASIAVARIDNATAPSQPLIMQNGATFTLIPPSCNASPIQAIGRYQGVTRSFLTNSF